ncbi:DUF1192 domain-containing protein [Roseicella aquatilis]|uniref:DUF1192 domain-containing protein n=1 Tax=Roseicella aquatilis TaxID=2527868 RepID=A0A4R4DHZ5_9PROT|nr:DUF1192 domain-containing protein [Roseicella aquatilis]TCZ59905.1 DUF1192 domain-containing protein [Roseicella aquatilis]
MMEEETARPVKGFVPAVLDSWDVEDLKHYIAKLQAEIARAEAAIAKKQAHRGAADAFFKKPGG